MVHGYHLILPMYGFWLPNDPRGSWSDFVRRWEFVKFGKATKTLDRKSLDSLTKQELENLEAARRSLTYPAVVLTGEQARFIGQSFALHRLKSNYTIWACAILPEHTHLVLARHTYNVEQMSNLLKGAATRHLIEHNSHPLQQYANNGGRPPRMWAAHEWKQYLDSEEAIEQAIAYVEANPAKEDKPKQKWSFVAPFEGLKEAGWTTYH